MGSARHYYNLYENVDHHDGGGGDDEVTNARQAGRQVGRRQGTNERLTTSVARDFVSMTRGNQRRANEANGPLVQGLRQS